MVYNVPTAPGRKHIIAGIFPPMSATGDRTASRLAYHLRASGKDVVTLSEPGRSFARVELIYRSKRLFAQTLDLLPTEGIAYVFASSLVPSNIDKPHLPNRLKEIWRRAALANQIGRRAKRVTYVLDRPATSIQFWLLLAAALTSAMPPRITTAKRLSRQLGLADIPENIAANTVFEIAFEGKDEPAGTVSPRSMPPLINTLKREGIIGEELVTTLRDIRQMVAETWKHGPHFLRNFHAIEGEGNVQAHQAPPEFMTHYRAFITANPNIANDVKQDDAKFQDWYLNSPFTQKAYPYLPVPTDLIPRPVTLTEAAASLLKFAPRVTDMAFLSPEQSTHFAARISDDPMSLSRAELYFAQCAELAVNPREFHEQIWTSDEIRVWFHTQICRAAPALLPFSTLKNPAVPPLPSANISGIVKGESGLAKNARMSARTLKQLNIPVTLRDFSTLYRIADQTEVATPRHLLRTLHLHHINADRIPREVLSTALSADNQPLHIGFMLWELNAIPPSHRLAGEMLDDIWTPSEFVRDIYEIAYGREVVNIGKALYLPDIAPPEPRQNYLFLTSFDNNSSVERKNPLATVQAFLDAFPTDPDVRLLVKATHPGPNDWGDPHGQMAQIKRLAVKDNRVVIDQRQMPYRDYLETFARADCIVSSHRAEGFGYVPAYGLFYEKPVIVTDYSGTQDFCNDTTAFPVRHRLKPVQPGEVIAMAEGAEWADIDVGDLAAQMRYVRENPDVAATRARAGRALIQRKYSPDAHAERYRQRLIQLGVIEN